MKQLKITKFPELDYAGSEAFNTLSTNLSFAGETVKKIMITSCHASEGKSYLSMNLMRTLAQRGMKVALVDADLRRSVVNAQYGLQFEDGRNDDKGLSHFLAGMVGMEEVIYQTDIPGALMVPVGRDVPNPLALLSNHHFKDLLDALAQRVDYVLVDAAPVGVAGAVGCEAADRAERLPHPGHCAEPGGLRQLPEPQVLLPYLRQIRLLQPVL